MTSPLPPRRDATAVLGFVPVLNRVSSQDVADLLTRFLNVDPTVLAGAVWAVFRDELDPGPT